MMTIAKLFQSTLVMTLPLSLAACGGGSDQTTATSTGASTSTGAGTGGADAGGGGGAGGGQVVGPCSPEALKDTQGAKTYFVAVNEPGASNSTCDGLAPTDQGNGHCPFKDLSSPSVVALLDGTKSTRLELRAGTYLVNNWDGLRVNGAGTSEAERLVLTSYKGEKVVLDVPIPDGAGCVAPNMPGCVRQVVRVLGQYTAVQGLTIQNGLGYNLEVNGGAHHLVRCNILTETADFPMRSDCLKLDGNTTDIDVLHNEFSHFRSQAIDMTNVSDVLVEGNDFHDPHDADAGATGCKYGARDVIIRGNNIHDLGSSTKTSVFSLGGTGSPHPDDFEAYRIHVVSNRISNVQGKLAQYASCKDCTFEKNDASNVGAGVLLSASATGLPECSADPAGCKAISGAVITGNRMKNFHGGGNAATANIFIVVDMGEANGLAAGDNIYCAPAAGAHRFGWLGGFIAFTDWVKASGTDASSKALVDGDPLCQGW